MDRQTNFSIINQKPARYLIQKLVQYCRCVWLFLYADIEPNICNVVNKFELLILYDSDLVLIKIKSLWIQTTFWYCLYFCPPLFKIWENRSYHYQIRKLTLLYIIIKVVVCFHQLSLQSSEQFTEPAKQSVEKVLLRDVSGSLWGFLQLSQNIL